jgi:NCAIR mutase (PurE)-related protein
MEFAIVDHHRSLRCGFAEVIFAEGKTTEQVVAIAEEIVRKGSPLLATRVSQDQGRALAAAVPQGQYHELPRVFMARESDSSTTGQEPAQEATVAVVAAGTSDLAVAEEAALTVEAMGQPVFRLTDVGVAGMHRLVPHLPRLARSAVIIVVAGMEGALASVMGGLVSCPVIAVPTSVGYGASLGGVAALLAMLNSCAPGVTVVNIDNGFGAGYAAARIVNSLPEES